MIRKYPLNSFGRQPKRGWAAHAFFQAAVDFLSVCFSVGLAYSIISVALAAVGLNYERPARLLEEFLPVFLAVVTALVGWFFFAGHYHRRVPFWVAAKNVVGGCLFAILLQGFGTFASKADPSRLLIFTAWVFAPICIMAARVALRRLNHSSGFGRAKVLVVGEEGIGEDAARLIQSDPHLGFSVERVMTPSSVEAILKAVEENTGLSYVLVALSGRNEIENDIVLALRAKETALIIVPVASGLPAGMEVQYLLGEESIFLVDKVKVVPRFNRACKRVFDVVLAALALVVAAIPMALVALLVKQDGGPALFAHSRIGLNGEVFDCLKFRSMSIHADKMLSDHLAADEDARIEWAGSRKLKNDPRVTKVGRFIRKTALDELPQLINVIRGDMALVGPRPVTQSELDYYASTVKLYSSVRPGITGLWQVSGRSDLNYDQRVRLDTWYVRNWSPWHDIAILLKTIPAVLSRRGAY
jgi:Undecaprenyl-phosphate galactose phosphotransferase WbaP